MDNKSELESQVKRRARIALLTNEIDKLVRKALADGVVSPHSRELVEMMRMELSALRLLQGEYRLENSLLIAILTLAGAAVGAMLTAGMRLLS